MEARVVFKESFTVIGMEVETRMIEDRIPQLWERFIPRLNEIKYRTSRHDTYGISEYSDNYVEEFFSYWACTPVDHAEEVPEGMVVRTVPAAFYAVVTHKGKLESMGGVFDYIHTVWLPNSGYELDKKDGFEVYGERFLGADNDQSETDVYVAVKKIAG